MKPIFEQPKAPLTVLYGADGGEAQRQTPAHEDYVVTVTETQVICYSLRVTAKSPEQARLKVISGGGVPFGPLISSQPTAEADLVEHISRYNTGSDAATQEG